MKSVFHRIIKFSSLFKYFSEYFHVTFLHKDTMIQVLLALPIIMHGIFMLVLWSCDLPYSGKFW